MYLTSRFVMMIFGLKTRMFECVCCVWDGGRCLHLNLTMIYVSAKYALLHMMVKLGLLTQTLY